jgi:hypothetical protein
MPVIRYCSDGHRPKWRRLKVTNDVGCIHRPSPGFSGCRDERVRSRLKRGHVRSGKSTSQDSTL